MFGVQPRREPDAPAIHFPVGRREGALAVKRAGGNVIVESEETAVIYGMPQQAIRAGAVDAVMPLQGIAPAILNGFADVESR